MKKIMIVILSLAALFGIGLLCAQETVPQTQTILKSYFTTGSVPTQTNYDELIDTLFYYVMEMRTNELAMLQAATNQSVLTVSAYPWFNDFSTPGSFTTTTAGVWTVAVHGIPPFTNVFSLGTNNSGSVSGTYNSVTLSFLPTNQVVTSSNFCQVTVLFKGSPAGSSATNNFQILDTTYDSLGARYVSQTTLWRAHWP